VGKKKKKKKKYNTKKIEQTKNNNNNKKACGVRKITVLSPTLLVNCCCLVGDAPCLFEKTSV